MKPKIEVWINSRRSGINVHVQAVTENGMVIHFNQSGFDSNVAAMSAALGLAYEVRKRLGAPANHSNNLEVTA